MPFALKPLVEKELDRLEAAGILRKVNSSDWATPIIPVPKKDGQLRICGDYKVTVNQALETEQYLCQSQRISLQHWQEVRNAQNLISPMPTCNCLLTKSPGSMLPLTLIVAFMNTPISLSGYHLLQQLFRR